jgi:very-short-patch-repair endonuclease
VQRAQLLDSGVSRHTITTGIANGHLHRVHRGVYLVGHTALAPLAREQAALLACGDGAVVSHWSAAYVWGLTERCPDLVHVTLVGRRCRPKDGICVHTTARLDRRDIRRRRGITLTAPARVLVDLAADATLRQLEELVGEARVNGLLREGDLENTLERAGAKAGVAQARAFLQAESEPSLTRSKAERLMRRLVQRAGLPTPRTNARVAGYEVDFVWPAQRVIVEIDGYRFHGHRSAFERDRRKGLALAGAGYTVIRISWRQLVHDPLLVAAELARALAMAA